MSDPINTFDLGKAEADRDRRRIAASALHAAADEFATGERVMERCTRGLVAAWLRDRAHLIESGERP